VPSSWVKVQTMLKISLVDGPKQRRLVLEGWLFAPWTAELRMAWQAASADLERRALVVDLENVAAISPDGEEVLLELLRQGARFRYQGALTRSIVRQLARQLRKNIAANAGTQEITE
jgi:hypothetical protein